MKHKWSISGQNHVFVILHKRKNRIGKPFVGGIIENINLSKINDTLQIKVIVQKTSQVLY